MHNSRRDIAKPARVFGGFEEIPSTTFSSVGKVVHKADRRG